MKRMKFILVAILLVSATFAIGATAESVLMKAQQRNVVVRGASQQTLFDAEITFYIYKDACCGHEPIIGAYVNASGGDGQDYEVTDDNGTCVLHLVINSEYRLTIEADGFQSVMFDFNIIDNQYFSFHMNEVSAASSQDMLNLHAIAARLLVR